VIFSRAFALLRKILAAHFTARARRERGQARARHLHTKLSRVTVIFLLL
jgi:hypothetical protein